MPLDILCVFNPRLGTDDKAIAIHKHEFQIAHYLESSLYF